MHLAGIPIEVWTADCTCLPMTQGFLYLVAIMILNHLLEDSYADHQRTLTYNFTSLKGTVFGIQTSDDHKLRIIDIIKRKCKEAGRTDFHLYQAFYCPRTGDIQGHELPVNLMPE